MSIIINGIDIWSTVHENHAQATIIRLFLKSKLACGGTSTHDAERSVKLANMCAYMSRYETLIYEYAACHWWNCIAASDFAFAEHHTFDVTKRKKIFVTRNESVRSKSSGLGLI